MIFKDFINYKWLKSNINVCIFWRANSQNEPFEQYVKSMYRLGMSIDAITIACEIMKFNKWPYEFE